MVLKRGEQWDGCRGFLVVLGGLTEHMSKFTALFAIGVCIRCCALRVCWVGIVNPSTACNGVCLVKRKCMLGLPVFGLVEQLG